MDTGPNGIYSIKNLKRLANILDDRYRVPFTRFRFGWDFIIGLVPVIGDLLTALAAVFILIGARKHQVSTGVQMRMLGNIVLDFLVGLVPVIGDFLDAGFRSNTKNIKLLLKAIESRQTASNLKNSAP